MVRFRARNIETEVFSVQPKTTVLIVSLSSVWPVIAVVLKVETAKLHEVVAVVLHVDSNSGGVISAATTLSANITMGPLHAFVAQLDIVSIANGNGAIG